MIDEREKNRKRNDTQLDFRVYENSDNIIVSKTTKARLNITIHPFLKEKFKEMCKKSSIAEEVEKFIRAKVENELGKKLIFK